MRTRVPFWVNNIVTLCEKTQIPTFLWPSTWLWLDIPPRISGLSRTDFREDFSKLKKNQIDGMDNFSSKSHSTISPLPDFPKKFETIITGNLFDLFWCSNTNCSPNNPRPGTRGSKVNAACQRWQSYAAELSIFSIINGEMALPTEFPHMVALGYANNRNGYDFDCGASLIADRWLLTAAHCIKDRKKPVIARMGKVNYHEPIVFVRFYLTCFLPSTSLIWTMTMMAWLQSIEISRYVFLTTTTKNCATVFLMINAIFLQRLIRHPEYINSKKKNDIALVEFDGDVEFNGDVHPACLQTDTHDVPESEELTIAGWGSIEAYVHMFPLFPFACCTRFKSEHLEFNDFS